MINSTSRLSYLVKKSLSEMVSDAEHTEMLELMNDPANEKDVKQELFNAYQAPKHLEDIVPEKSKQILEAIWQSDKKPIVRRFNFNSLRWTAAAAILLVCFSASIYFLKHKEQPTIMAKHQNDVLPGGNRATLTLADGSVISLTDANQGKIASQAGLVITKQADGQLLYEVINQEEENIEGYNTISTPFGGKYEVILKDGTKIILNSGSKITYPLTFQKDSRRVILTGEAYFEVAKDKDRPFTVSTPAANGIQSQEVKVLGTHFNINAYDNERSYVTTLLEGSVKIETRNNKDGKILKPGQQSLVRQSIKVVDADIDEAVAWINGFFYFKDKPAEDMMRELARWYDIEVVYSNVVPSIGFWGQISKNKKLSEVLELIEETNGVHFKIEGRKVVVM